MGGTNAYPSYPIIWNQDSDVIVDARTVYVVKLMKK